MHGSVLYWVKAARNASRIIVETRRTARLMRPKAALPYWAELQRWKVRKEVFLTAAREMQVEVDRLRRARQLEEMSVVDTQPA